ncbi:hypothetical protein FAZ69_17465 [Trinickia terrae]|uniref:DUF2189 domain-containing protein n=1 Tax=Trinickia terrae TaxID=2571161 RepID=A0A4U1I442_9BURK|nr:BPSS1780 family membrane protein [Trinickia terrae]TKC88038.1 hypothetical protein FAZ69_17465 [Trinickia terrae]
MLMRTVPARQGAQWIADGWALFRLHPWIWIALGVIDLLVSLILDSIPYASALTSVFAVLWTGGMAAAAERCRTTGFVRIADVADGMRAKLQPLFAAALFALLVTIVCDLSGSRVEDSFSLLLKTVPSQQVAGVWHDVPWLSLLVYLVAAVGGTMALWLAPTLIVLADAAPVDALKASFAAACRNVWPTLIYGLIVAGLAIASLVTLGLGLLVIVPLLYLSSFAACRELFTLESPESS